MKLQSKKYSNTVVERRAMLGPRRSPRNSDASSSGGTSGQPLLGENNKSSDTVQPAVQKRIRPLPPLYSPPPPPVNPFVLQNPAKDVSYREVIVVGDDVEDDPIIIYSPTKKITLEKNVDIEHSGKKARLDPDPSPVAEKAIVVDSLVKKVTQEIVPSSPPQAKTPPESPVRRRRGRPFGSRNGVRKPRIDGRVKRLEEAIDSLSKKLDEQTAAGFVATTELRTENARLSYKIQKLERENRKLRKQTELRE